MSTKLLSYHKGPNNIIIYQINFQHVIITKTKNVDVVNEVIRCYDSKYPNIYSYQIRSFIRVVQWNRKTVTGEGDTQVHMEFQRCPWVEDESGASEPVALCLPLRSIISARSIIPNNTNRAKPPGPFKPT